MNRLLSANFARLRKNKLFWAGIIFMAAYGAYKPVSAYRISVRFESTLQFDSIFFGYAFIIGIVTAIFISLFLGTEYSDGTIRNKLIAGHSRSKVYFSNLIVTSSAVLFMCLSYILAVSAVGIPLAGFFHTDITLVLHLFFGTLFAVLSFCSVYTFLSMVCSNKSTIVAVAVSGSFIFLFGEAYISSMLSTPGYISGIKRSIFEFIFDLLPSGQAIQYTNMEPSDLWQKMTYSLLITVAAAAAGAVLFNRKDIK